VAKPWLEVRREHVELPNGKAIEDFYRVMLPEFAVSVPVTPNGELVMVRGYKHGLGRLTLSAPAGYVQAGESPLQAAQRELLEETGFSATDWEALGTCVTDGNRQCGTAHLFIARHAVAVTEPVNPDPFEQLQVELLNPDSFLRAVRSGEIALLATIAAVGMAIACEAGSRAN
jgi:ADP-ribose pyrophosphatase